MDMKIRADALKRAINNAFAKVHDSIECTTTVEGWRVDVELANIYTGARWGIWVYADAKPDAAIRTIRGALSAAWPRLMEVHE